MNDTFYLSILVVLLVGTTSASDELGWQADANGKGTFVTRDPLCRPENGNRTRWNEKPIEGWNRCISGTKDYPTELNVEYRSLIRPSDFERFDAWYTSYGINCTSTGCDAAWCCGVSRPCPPDIKGPWHQVAPPTSTTDRICERNLEVPTVPPLPTLSTTVAVTTTTPAPEIASPNPTITRGNAFRASTRFADTFTSTTVITAITPRSARTTTPTPTPTPTTTDVTNHTAAKTAPSDLTTATTVAATTKPTPPTTDIATTTPRTTTLVSTTAASADDYNSKTTSTVPTTTDAATGGIITKMSTNHMWLSLVCSFVLVGVIVSVLASKVPSLIKKRKAEAWGSDDTGGDGGWVQLHNASCSDDVPLQLVVGSESGSTSPDPLPQRTHQRQRTASSHHAEPLMPVLDIDLHELLDIDLLDFEGTSNFPNITETVIDNAPLPAYSGKGEDAGALLDALEREFVDGCQTIHTPATSSAPLGQHRGNRNCVSGGTYEAIGRFLPGSVLPAATHQSRPLPGSALPAMLLPSSALSEMDQPRPLDGFHSANITSSSIDHNNSSDDSSISSISSVSGNNSPMLLQATTYTNRAIANQPLHLELTVANLHAQLPDPTQVHGRQPSPQHRHNHNHMSAAGEALRQEFASPSEQTVSVGCIPFIYGGRGVLDNPRASANSIRSYITSKVTHTPLKSKVKPPAAEDEEHEEWRNGRRPLMDPSCKWHSWVLELSAKHRKELFKIYNITDDTMDVDGTTIKYSSRRMKQNRAQHLYLKKRAKDKKNRSKATARTHHNQPCESPTANSDLGPPPWTLPSVA